MSNGQKKGSEATGKNKMIVKTPGTCGGSARINGTRMAVYFLYECRLGGMSDIDILKSYPHINQAQLDEVWRYANENMEEILIYMCCSQTRDYYG